MHRRCVVRVGALELGCAEGGAQFAIGEGQNGACVAHMIGRGLELAMAVKEEGVGGTAGCRDCTRGERGVALGSQPFLLGAGVGIKKGLVVWRAKGSFTCVVRLRVAQVPRVSVMVYDGLLHFCDVHGVGLAGTRGAPGGCQGTRRLATYA